MFDFHCFFLLEGKKWHVADKERANHCEHRDWKPSNMAKIVDYDQGVYVSNHVKQSNAFQEYIENHFKVLVWLVFINQFAFHFNLLVTQIHTLQKCCFSLNWFGLFHNLILIAIFKHFVRLIFSSLKIFRKLFYTFFKFFCLAIFKTHVISFRFIIIVCWCHHKVSWLILIPIWSIKISRLTLIFLPLDKAILN